MLNHLKRLELLTYFKAPAQRKINPIRVTKRKEYLELMLGGHVLFPGPDGKDTLYGRGTLFWHRGGENTIHRYHSDDPYSCYSIEFEVEGGERICPRVTIPLHTEQLLVFAEDVFRRYHAGEHDNPAFCAMVYSTLYWFATGPQKKPGESYPDALKIALDFMEQHLDCSLHLNEIADVAEISRSNLFAAFKQYLKISPHQYLLKLRINRAKQLLAAGEKSIKEIAFDCGFESLEVFYRQFSRNEGTTPATYRKRFSLMDLN